MQYKRALAIFAKAPTPGQVKTRLIPALGADGAANLYRSFLLDAVELAKRISSCDAFIFYTPQEQLPALRHLFELPTELVPQRGNHLGSRMSNAFHDLFALGYESAAIVGTDLPTLPLSRLTTAFTALESKPVVLGPSLDGGYYLIGLRRLYPGLFERIEWSTRQVLGQTLDRIAELGLAVECLEPWYDVDTPDDLDFLVSHLRLLMASGKSNLPRHTVNLLRRLGRLL